MKQRVESAPDASRSPDSHGMVLAGIASIAGVVAASSCCLPVLPFVLAAGFAGSSAFLTAARPYLMGASVLLVGYGFFQARRLRRCQRRPSVISMVLLWASAAFVFASIFLPQLMANAVADLLRN